MGDSNPRDGVAQAYYWASRGMTVSLEFVLPALGGLWLDRVWPFGPLGLMAGAILGFGLGLYHLLRIASENKRPSDRS